MESEAVKQGKSTPPVETRWKPGQSGNPSGRPKKKTLMETIREKLMEEGAPHTQEDIADKYITAMLAGSMPHLKEYIDRQEGKVPDRVANADGSNLQGVDLTKLSTDDLTVLRALRLKMQTSDN